MTSSDAAAGRFPDLSFGGGGTRCFWHGGFIGAIRDLLAPTKRIRAVSGGVLSALSHVTRQEDRLLDIMGGHFDIAKAGQGNVNWARKRAGGDLLIHQKLYRQIIGEMLDTAAAVDAVANGPQFEVQLATPARIGALATVLSYAAEVPMRGTPHVHAARRLGARALFVDARQAARDGRLVDLVVAAASSPPAFDAQYWDGRHVIDGGVMNNAPAHDNSEDQLILVTRPYRNMPLNGEGRTYVGPRHKIATNKLDFTDRSGIEAAWQQGQEDGAAFRATLAHA